MLNSKKTFKLAGDFPQLYENAKSCSKTNQATVEEFSHDYQIVLVNDYPFDNTFSVIKELCEEDHKITGVNLSAICSTQESEKL